MESSPSTSPSDSSTGDQSVASNTHTSLFDRSYSNVIYGYVTRSSSKNILLSTFGPPTDGAADGTASFFAALANIRDSILLSAIAIQQRLAQDVSSSSAFVLPPLVPPRLPHRVGQQLRNLQNLHQTVQDNEGHSSSSSPPDESKPRTGYRRRNNLCNFKAAVSWSGAWCRAATEYSVES